MTENRTKKLVAPGITEGEWRFYGRAPGNHAVAGNKAVAITVNDANSAANARFLSGSKRVAEAAAALFDDYDLSDLDALRAEWRELYDALIQAGYTEQVHD